MLGFVEDLYSSLLIIYNNVENLSTLSGTSRGEEQRGGGERGSGHLAGPGERVEGSRAEAAHRQEGAGAAQL